MRSFIFVLIVTILALGDTFLRIAELADPEAEGNLPLIGFWSSAAFSYQMSLGDFDTGAFGERAYFMVYLFFIINTMFNTIVMFNLLISIMMEAYGRIAGDALGAAYQEKCRMIAENSYLISDSAKLEQTKQGKYLIMAFEKAPPKKETPEEMIKYIKEGMQKLLKGKAEPSSP